MAIAMNELREFANAHSIECVSVLFAAFVVVCGCMINRARSWKS